MKTSNVLASVLFSTIALAAPVDKRAYATKTEVKIEYYTVYTTVTGAQPAAAATSDPALFYEDKPKYTAPQPTTVVTSSSPSSTAVPSVVVPTTSETKPEPTTTSVYTPPPVKTTEAPPAPPASTEAPPPPPSSTLVPEPKPEPKPEPSQASKGDGEVHTGGSYTMNYYRGARGACGDKIFDEEPAVALAADLFGEATVDYMTGLTNNPWCGKKIEITNNGMTATAFIKDRCTGCTNGGLDATEFIWKATTGGLGGPNGDRIYSMSWRVVE